MHAFSKYTEQKRWQKNSQQVSFFAEKKYDDVK